MRWFFGERWSGFDEMIIAQVKYTPRGNIRDEKATKSWYEEHNQAVRDAVPAEKLLVFNAKQGWEPLCQFLEQPVPDMPYPRVFEKEEYLMGINARAQGKNMNRVRRLLWYGAASFIVIAVTQVDLSALGALPRILGF